MKIVLAKYPHAFIVEGHIVAELGSDIALSRASKQLVVEEFYWHGCTENATWPDTGSP